MTLQHAGAGNGPGASAERVSGRVSIPRRDWPLRALLALLRRVGVRIQPFITMREGLAPTGLEHQAQLLNVVPITAAAIDDLVRHMPNADGGTLRGWFGDDKICFGLRAGSDLIATMWCDLRQFNYPPNYRLLAADEAYLFAAYIDPRYRGQNLAPLMRVACYEELRKLGRRRFCSYSEYLNTSARRFKAKVGAAEEELRVHFSLFGKWSRTLTVRRYAR